MPITNEEAPAIIEAITAGTPLNEIEGLKELGADVVIKTTEQLATFKANSIESGVEEAIKPKIAELHKQYDQDLEEVYGDAGKRPQDVKTYDFNKQLHQGNIKKIGELNETITALKETGGDTAALVTKYEKTVEDLRTEFAGKLEVKTTLATSLQGKLDTQKVIHSVRETFAGVKAKFIKELPPMFDSVENAYVTDISSRVKASDGVLYVTDEEGKILTDDNMAKITLEAHAKVKFKDVIDNGNQAVGSGAGAGGAGNAGGAGTTVTLTDETVETYALPDGIDTKLKLAQHLERDLKLSSKDANFNKLMTRLGAPLKTR